MKNVGHMMVIHNITTVREFMFWTWPKIRMERLFLQLIKKKLTNLDKFSPPNYHKTFKNPRKFQKKSPLPLQRGGGGNYVRDNGCYSMTTIGILELRYYAGPFRRFWISMWQNAHINTVRHVMLSDVYFTFSKIL